MAVSPLYASSPPGIGMHRPLKLGLLATCKVRCKKPAKPSEKPFISMKLLPHFFSEGSLVNHVDLRVACPSDILSAESVNFKITFQTFGPSPL